MDQRWPGEAQTSRMLLRELGIQGAIKAKFDGKTDMNI